MAKKPAAPSKKSKKANSATNPCFGWLKESILSCAKIANQAAKEASSEAKVVVVGEKVSDSTYQKYFKSLPEWLQQRRKKTNLELIAFHGPNGPRWMVFLNTLRKPQQHGDQLDRSPFAKARDLVGQAIVTSKEMQINALEIEFVDANEEEQLGAIVGAEMAFYEYRRLRSNSPFPPPPQQITVIGSTKAILQYGAELGAATNLARHLTNVPAGELFPDSYEKAVRWLFSNVEDISIESITGDALLADNMNLLHAVGRGALSPPRLVHIRYRPKKAKKQAPVAFVGKGITFDTGGLDMKDANNMRLMKKDMGGSASVVGATYLIARQQWNFPFDAYLALAENAVDERSFHPGDVITARNGKTVEIHNTDAEGRLVLADAIDYALSQEGPHEPTRIIDVATLTGAIKVALGAEVSGLFCNHDELAEEMLDAAKTSGERSWRMPLVQEYRALLATPMADMLNAATTGFGGAIVAALFIETFTRNKPWVHFDIYAWTDRISGPFREVGATGQGVQLLARWCEGHLKS
jgi:leucyl aminopeptidase